MPALLTGLSALSTGVGLVGSVLGGNSSGRAMDERRRRIDESYGDLRELASSGFGNEQLGLMRKDLTVRLGSEFGGASAALSARLRRQGASAGATNQALGSLFSQRMQALGQGLTQIDLANQRMKTQALGQLASFSQTDLRTDDDESDIFGQLFGMGLGGLVQQYQSKDQFGQFKDALETAGPGSSPDKQEPNTKGVVI